MMRVSVRFIVPLFIVFALGFQPAKADDPQVFSDIQRIIKAGVLRVAMLGKDVPPLIMTKADGELSGTEPNLARDLAQRLGVEVEFIRSMDTYDDVVDMVARKEADIAVSYLTGGVQRGLYVLFSQPYIQQSGRLFYNRAQFAKLRRDYDIDDLQAIDNLPAASELVVGVEAGSVNQTILARDFPHVQLKTFGSLDEIMAAVRAGDIFAGLHGSLHTHFFMRRHPATAIYIAIDSNIRLPSDIRIAVRPDAPNLLRWIDLYLANHVGMLDHMEILDRYLNNGEPA